MKTSRFLTVIAVCCLCLTSVMNATPLHAQNTEDRKEVTNSVGMKLVQIPAGTFMMARRQAKRTAPATKRSIR